MPKLDRSLLAGLPSFAGLAGEALDGILSLARSQRYSKDSEVFSQHQEARSFYLLLSGHIRVVRTSPEGRQVIARYINKGEFFGIAVAIGTAAYPASAVAAVDCVALSWPNAAWPQLQARFPAFGAAAVQTIGTRLQETQAQVMAMSTEQVEQRIAHAILKLLKESGREAPDGIEIDFPISRRDLAEMTGTTLHTVSRLLSSWEGEGLIRSGRQKVTVRDPRALTLIAENRRRN